jgi:hypothetical protein
LSELQLSTTYEFLAEDEEAFKLWTHVVKEAIR